MAISWVGKIASSDLITMNGQWTRLINPFSSILLYKPLWLQKKQLLNHRYGPMEAIDRENYGPAFHQARSHRFCAPSQTPRVRAQARSQAMPHIFLPLGVLLDRIAQVGVLWRTWERWSVGYSRQKLFKVLTFFLIEILILCPLITCMCLYRYIFLSQKVKVVFGIRLLFVWKYNRCCFLKYD